MGYLANYLKKENQDKESKDDLIKRLEQELNAKKKKFAKQNIRLSQKSQQIKQLRQKWEKAQQDQQKNETERDN